MKPFLIRCGYSGPRLVENYRFDSQAVPLAAFAHQPADARSACITAVDSDGDSKATAASCRALGAPVVLVCHEGTLEWWKQTQTPTEPELQETLTRRELAGFFKKHQTEFNPNSIYRAKTLGRFQRDQQLHFVDLGLMPLVEAEIGERLSNLVVRVVTEITSDLEVTSPTDEDRRQVFKSAFWLLGAKMLHDKRVERFKRINLLDVEDVFERVGKHYADTQDLPPRGQGWKRALEHAARSIGEFAHLGNVSTEALGYLYEAAFVDKQLRKVLSTHSTPSYLVDYMLWQLAPWIEEIPEQDRYVFEPACGHAAFLVSAMRILRLLTKRDDQRALHKYLKARLWGVEKDRFALEIARLSLTLADVPNPNGWHLIEDDMFDSVLLEREAGKSHILLANPPFERFTEKERQRYARGRSSLALSKPVEMLTRALPHLPPKAVFGIVLPQGVLHSQEAKDIRRRILGDFELSEICLFPDKVFRFSDAESVILLGRRRPARTTVKPTIRYRRVREHGLGKFRHSYLVDSDRVVEQGRFEYAVDQNLLLPELDELWRALDHQERASALADVGQGLIHQGRDLPQGAWTIRANARPNDVRGFAEVPADLPIYGLPPEVGMNLDKAVIRRPVSGTTTGIPQVLLNYARVSRGPWRLKAIIDADGHAVNSSFITVRPTSPTFPLEFLWTLLNSPLANAYVYSHSLKRHNLVGIVRKIPIPNVSTAGIQSVVSAARAYLGTVEEPEPFMHPDTDRLVVKDALLRMDAEVLRLYDLPPRLERQLLDLFAGEERKGVGCRFDGYFPPDFKPFVPLYEYISEEYRRSTAAEMRARYKPVSSPATLAALDKACELFAEE